MQWDGWSKLAALMAMPLIGILLALGVYAAQSSGEVAEPGLEMLKYLGIAFGTFIVELLIGPWVNACASVWKYERTIFLNNRCKLYWVQVRTLPFLWMKSKPVRKYDTLKSIDLHSLAPGCRGLQRNLLHPCFS